MTTGFQTQQYNYSPIVRTAAKPQATGSKLKPADGRDMIVAPEKRSFKDTRISR